MNTGLNVRSHVLGDASSLAHLLSILRHVSPCSLLLGTPPGSSHSLSARAALPLAPPVLPPCLLTCTFLMPSMRRSRLSGSSLVTASTTILAKKSRSPDT